MSAPRIRHLAKLVKGLTYDEMMEVAEWFSVVVVPVDENGDLGSRVATASEMAQYFSDWADNNLEGDD